eukprot:scaffold401140_cov34-Prasinocladus_malaysianus.AAC.2
MIDAEARENSRRTVSPNAHQAMQHLLPAPWQMATETTGETTSTAYDTAAAVEYTIPISLSVPVMPSVYYQFASGLEHCHQDEIQGAEEHLGIDPDGLTMTASIPMVGIPAATAEQQPVPEL